MSDTSQKIDENFWEWLKIAPVYITVFEPQRTREVENLKEAFRAGWRNKEYEDHEQAI